MESTYNSQRKRNIFSVDSTDPFTLSRSKVENFMRCQRCFYLDRKYGTGQPPMFPYTLNNAVDTLLKNEFDLYRAKKEAHPYCISNGVDAIPFSHTDLDNWRMWQRGIRHHHEATNFIVTGAVDDVWVNSQGELIIVDYKATSSNKEVTLDDRDSYKRQMEIYQWLFRKNGFKVSKTGYFVYCNGDSSKDCFAGALQFKISLLPYEGNDEWIEKTLFDIKECLTNNKLPSCSENCDYCTYCEAIKVHIMKYEDK